MRLVKSFGSILYPAEQHAPLVRALAASSLLCVSLGLVRAVVLRHSMLMWLDWNLLLAWMPLLFALGLRHTLRARPVRSAGSRARSIAALAAGWLLFLPNAPYLVTDFVHLKVRYPVPVWFDILLFMSFAWTGLTLGFLSLRILQEEVARAWGHRRGRWFGFAALVLCSFGVYMGRVGRWNTWDVLVHPLALTAWCVRSLLPSNFVETMTFCGPMCLFLLVVHRTLQCVSAESSRHA